ncbi:MAG: hypothetical protein V3W34_11280 [Phycisphaerae bacterium]
MASISYQTVEHMDVEELAEFYARQGQRSRSSSPKLEAMVENSFCFVTARQGDRLIGIARGLTDGVRGQLVECKLDPECQGPAAVTKTQGRIEHDREGIARTMALRVIDALREYGVEEIHVMAYGTEVDFCEELGFKRVGGMVALRMEVAPVEAFAARA